MQINWYPGHMARTRRMIKENLSLVDVVLELTDARAPFTTHLPDLKQLIGTKELIVLLNKADLADEKVTELWIEKFAELGIRAIDVDTITRRGLSRLVSEIKKFSPNTLKRPTRCMVLGVTNVGKSSIINQMAGRKGAKTGNKPGVTRGKMWLKVDQKLELLDTPGILWPKFEKKSTGIKLALLGSIKDELLDLEKLALLLIRFLKEKYPLFLGTRYKVDLEDSTPISILEQLSKNRGFLLSGGIPDTQRGANTLINEFRLGKLGKISLESPDDDEGIWQDM